jgi:hypothetical protein
MTSLAGTLCSQRDLAGARELQERTLDACLRLLGEEHPSSLMAMNNLAATLYMQGDRSRARKLQKQVLETRLRLLGEEHSDTLTAKKNLARMKPRTLRHWLQLMFG